MKRYLLFMGEYYYPRMGWLDFVRSSNSIDELEVFMCENPDHNVNWYNEWAQIVDTTTEQIVRKFVLLEKGWERDEEC